MQESEGPSWQYDYNTFVDFDTAGRKQFADAMYELYHTAKKKQKSNYQPVVGQPDSDEEQLQTLPPVLINGTWKDALKNPRKIVLRH